VGDTQHHLISRATLLYDEAVLIAQLLVSCIG
jgi:hypothetical protein